MENRFYVYSHHKKTDGKCFYIGKGTGNRYKALSGRNKYWKNIVKKHGFESLILVSGLSEEKAFELEANFCKQIGYDNLCNLHVENGWGGHSPTEETKIKIYTFKRNKKVSESLKGYKQTREHVLKRSSHLKGKSNIKNKKPKPEGFGEKVSEKLKGHQHPHRWRKVSQYDLKDNFIREFGSITEACYIVFNDFSKNANITGCCKGRLKSAYGFKWKYS